MKKISIIIPVYNVEKYIEECITSLLSQSYHNYEIIIVNDDTQDASIDKIRYLIDCNSNIKLVEKENGGLSSARNFGLKYATGEFISFVDSDDFIDKDFLKLMMSAIGDADICSCGYKEVNEEGQFIRQRNNVFFATDDLFGKAIECINIIPNAWGKVYRKELFNDIKYPEGMLFEDYAVLYQLSYGKKIVFQDNALYNYRIRSGSIMRDFNNNIIDHKFIILNEIYNFLNKNKIYHKYKNNYSNAYIYHGVFVTSCIIINQTYDLSLLLKMLSKVNTEVFTLNNIMFSKSIPKSIKLYLLILKYLPSIAISLKRIQNKIKS
ncbi:glycosyltransferase family 2 protein [Klebsiella variicola subsp. variicola]|uniref:Glycosyl transferase n=2 Tax=Klebsiella pneumoniae TaxID=573 RepID=A0A193SC46_KLEPN|nr:MULTISPECIES: glycosyltransferase family 2 protein [Klebsiella]AYB65179.1 glycosyltransferase family 2 protein [Klebsiella pneumoniae]EKW0521866.1 glycosyltransferase family 2 protein [Klebsiella pneumoniae]EMB2526103.1 glycosyltransferase family 2 protein [Klebsiella pneumoniae]MBC4394903.1 glycosyltransferase family 2 protein [Klebsiella pneumoniae]MBZ1853027.1 glycosyltransferase family 2 protein [Klebsiella pneumoniae]